MSRIVEALVLVALAVALVIAACQGCDRQMNVQERQINEWTEGVR